MRCRSLCLLTGVQSHVSLIGLCNSELGRKAIPNSDGHTLIEFERRCGEIERQGKLDKVLSMSASKWESKVWLK